MGWRFRYRVPLGKLARINLSSRGLTFSVGKSPFTVNFGKRMRYTSSVPGTGLSYVSEGGQEPISYRQAGSASWRILKVLLFVVSALAFVGWLSNQASSPTTNVSPSKPEQINSIPDDPSNSLSPKPLESAPLPPRRPAIQTEAPTRHAPAR